MSSDLVAVENRPDLGTEHADTFRGDLHPDLRADYVPANPSIKVARRFDELTAPHMVKIKANAKRSRTLAALRDTLLPKLLSGELSVAGIS